MPPGIVTGILYSGCEWEEGNWDFLELQTIESGIYDLAGSMGGTDKFIDFIGKVNVIKTDKACGRGCFRSWGHKLEILDGRTPPTSVDIINTNSIDKWTVVHELGHAWDSHKHWKLSKGLEVYTSGKTSWWGRYPSGCDTSNRLPGCNTAGYFYGGIPPAGSDNNFNRKEDFAESVTAYVYPVVAQSKVVIYNNDPTYGSVLYYADYTQTTRWSYINSLIDGTITP